MRPPPAGVELWGGIECTVNRVGDRYFDQLERSGHHRRIGDLDLVASLGARALRYPVLWERTAPDGPRGADWSWADARLARLRDLDVRPIVTLVHHGSGPRHTSLVDPGFAPGLAAFARAVAERYPWIRDYTPVNEPLTTARFSGLYGHWYPHGRDDPTFARSLVEQVRAIVLAMKAIRAVVPDARLIQTEDTGRTYSTPLLAYQAALENERRWLGLDLLCGRVDRSHPLRRFLVANGIGEAELDWFLETPTPPDVVGLNYYLTSDRMLDERQDRYPAWSHGGNGRHAYADVEAARGRPEGILGHAGALRTAWERYRLPVAFTEVHHGGGREEQLRWLREAWEAARAVRAEGAEVRAITVWSLFGAYDWDRLVTEERGFYEPGAFDVRGPRPRPTAIARAVRALARGRAWAEPAAEGAGWWRRRGRCFGPDRPEVCSPARNARPVLIVGGRGTLGSAFERICRARGLEPVAAGRDRVDAADADSVARALDALEPWAVINAAGYVRVDEAEGDRERCWRENVEGPRVLADRCSNRGVRLISFSSDLVFDGEADRPYVESDGGRPLCWYGRTKHCAEGAVLDRMPEALVVRTSAFFGPWDRANFVTRALASLGSGRPVRAAADLFVTPTYVPDLVHACLDLLVDGEAGIWHLANRGTVSWAELAGRVAELRRLDRGLVVPVAARDLGFAAPRPRRSPLGSERGPLLAELDDALGRYTGEREADELPAGGGRVAGAEPEGASP